MGSVYWTTPQDDFAVAGWLHADPEVERTLNVVAYDAAGGNPKFIDDANDRRRYFSQYNNRAMVAARLNDFARYERELNTRLIESTNNRRQLHEALVDQALLEHDPGRHAGL